MARRRPWEQEYCSPGILSPVGGAGGRLLRLLCWRSDREGRQGFSAQTRERRQRPGTADARGAPGGAVTARVPAAHRGGGATFLRRERGLCREGRGLYRKWTESQGDLAGVGRGGLPVASRWRHPDAPREGGRFRGAGSVPYEHVREAPAEAREAGGGLRRSPTTTFIRALGSLSLEPPRRPQPAGGQVAGLPSLGSRDALRVRRGPGFASTSGGVGGALRVRRVAGQALWTGPGWWPRGVRCLGLPRGYKVLALFVFS